jgi:hypothetical protein
MSPTSPYTDLLAAALLLAGWSYGYVLKAETRDGKVVFLPAPLARRSQGTGCLVDFTVKTKDGETVWE